MMQTRININKIIEIKYSNIKDIFDAFKILMVSVFENFVKQILCKIRRGIFRECLF